MAQPSVIQFFNSRKRPITEHKANLDCPKRKILKLEQDASPKVCFSQNKRINKKPAVTKERNTSALNTPKIEKKIEIEKKVDDASNSAIPSKKPADLKQIKTLMQKNSKLNELKESLRRFKKSEERLKIAESKTNALLSPTPKESEEQLKAAESTLQSPKLKTFRSINFEVTVSPEKAISPQKPYLSPKKDLSVRRNLLNDLSPLKRIKFNEREEETEAVLKSYLQLPLKYKTIVEIFRAIDTVVQILYNRKELITFNKLKPAVEKMLKRTLLLKHLAQIKSISPNAYDFAQEKVKTFGGHNPQWELVVKPKINAETMTTQVLIDRRKQFHQVLVDRIINYHDEFLKSLTPPMIISKDKITRWHPEFDLEKVPEIELSDLPESQPTLQNQSGKMILENMRQLFNKNCEQRSTQDVKDIEVKPPEISEKIEAPTLKGIPKALLEKIRQKQSAKLCISMTRTPCAEKEVQMYARLPQMARLLWNLFVTEKKSVLELDLVIEKLGNSCGEFIDKVKIEEHLRKISELLPKWLIFHKLRNSAFVKLHKNADLKDILNKLDTIAKEKKDLLV